MSRVFILAGFIFLFSCGKKEQFPQFKSEKIDLSGVSLLGKLDYQHPDFVPDIVWMEQNGSEIKRLADFQDQYFQKNEAFDFERFCREWSGFVARSSHLQLNAREKIRWFNISGTLLQITGDAKYAEEMDKTLHSGLPEYSDGNKKTAEIVAPYIFTKNIDHVYVNLYVPSEISYEHSLQGKVKIRQEFPAGSPDSIYIKFDMEKERYVELFVRIPGWAEGATVTVKNVKYIAPPGNYCQIAKEWKNGDVVEIYFPGNREVANL